jgi:hypothetical protein
LYTQHANLENADGDWRHAPYRARLEELAAQFGGLVGNLFVAETVTGDRWRAE